MKAIKQGQKNAIPDEKSTRQNASHEIMKRTKKAKKEKRAKHSQSGFRLSFIKQKEK
jgi:hypothetical protein